jgi:chemotaxis protein methyltransferase CheR
MNGAAVFGEPGELTAEDFQRLTRLVHAAAGINLAKGKEGLVRARLAARIRALGLANYKAYVDIVAKDPNGSEMDVTIDLLTTNKTSFFREDQHFKLLTDMMARNTPNKLRIWSAACSTGEEPYSIAMTLAAAGAVPPACDLKILGTDICRQALATAEGATYPTALARDVPATLARRYLEQAEGGNVRIRQSLRDLISFARLNLMGSWPMRGPFDVIFCRNVMIYFDHPTQERLVARMRTLLAPGGLLLIGAAESLSALRHDYTYQAPATYSK